MEEKGRGGRERKREKKGEGRGGEKGEEKGGIVLYFKKISGGKPPYPLFQIFWGGTPQTPLVRIPNEGALLGLKGS